MQTTKGTVEMKTKIVITSGLLLAAVLSLTAAPVEAQKPSSVQKAQFDENGSSFRFGEKTVTVAPNGYIVIKNSDKEIANVYFYGNTPYSSFFDNRIKIKKVPVAFTKKKTGVSSSSSDKEQNAFIIKGEIPYHKEGETELLGDYTQTVSLTPDSKIRIRLQYTRPESAEKGSLSMVLRLPQAKSYTNDKEPKEFGEKWVELKKKFPVIANGTDADNTFRIISIMMKQMWAVPGKQIHFVSIADKREPNIRIIEFELDFLNGKGQK